MDHIWDHFELSKYWSNICHPMGGPYEGDGAVARRRDEMERRDLAKAAKPAFWARPGSISKGGAVDQLCFQ